MATTVELLVDPARVQAREWARVYDESWKVLQAYPLGAMGMGERVVAGEDVLCFGSSYLVTQRSSYSGWQVCGDATTRRAGELFSFPSELGQVRSVASGPIWRPRRVDLESSGGVVRAVPAGPNDLLARVVLERARGNVFSNETYGEPYHYLICAIAILVENRLPGAAIAFGALDQNDARHALELLRAALGEEFRGPLWLDAERCEAELSRWVGNERAKELVAVRTPLEPLCLELVLQALGASPASLFEQSLRDCVADEETELSAIDRWCIRVAMHRVAVNGAVQATDGSIATRFDVPDAAVQSASVLSTAVQSAGAQSLIGERPRVAALPDQANAGAAVIPLDRGWASQRRDATRRTRQRWLVRLTRQLPLILTEWAWNDVEVASPDMLEFLTEVVSVNRRDRWRSHCSHERALTRAVFESRIVRDVAFTEWREAKLRGPESLQHGLPPDLEHQLRLERQALQREREVALSVLQTLANRLPYG